MRAPIFYDSDNTGYYVDPTGNSVFSNYVDAGQHRINSDTNNRFGVGFLVLRNDSPTIYFQDTDHNSAMLHCNSNLLYVLRGGNDTTGWTQVNGQWPFVFDLSNNNATCGGILEAITDVRAPIFYDRANTGYYLDPAGDSYISRTRIVYNAFTAGADSYTLEIFSPDQSDNTKQVSIRFHQGGQYYYQIRANTEGFRFTEGGSNNLTSVTMGNTYTNSLGVGTAASGTAGEIRATNNITAYYSDDRLKTRSGNISNALEKVLSLNGFYFRANKKAQEFGYSDELQVGVSAQEVEAILPEIVVPAPIDEQYKTVRYEKLIPLLIEAIKEQQIRIDTLERNLCNIHGN